MRLRKEPNNFIFSDIEVNSSTISTQFIDAGPNANIQSTVTTTKAVRKVHYSCASDISNCSWEELVP